MPSQDAYFATSRVVFWKLSDALKESRTGGIIEILRRHALGKCVQTLQHIDFECGSLCLLMRKTCNCCNHREVLTQIPLDAGHWIANAPSDKRNSGSSRAHDRQAWQATSRAKPSG